MKSLFKSKQFLIILGVVILIFFVFCIFFISTSGTNKKNNIDNNVDRNEEKVLLKCEKTLENQNTQKVDIAFYLSEIIDGRKLKYFINIKYLNNEDIPSDISSSFVLAKYNYEEKLKYFGDCNCVELESSYDDDSMTFIFLYYINSKSNKNIKNQLEFDFLNSSVSEIRKYFEDGGLTCQVY